MVFHYLPARSFPCPLSFVIIVGSSSGGVPHDCRIVVKELRSFSFNPSTITNGGLLAASVMYFIRETVRQKGLGESYKCAKN